MYLVDVTDLRYIEQEGCVQFQNGNILQVAKNLDGYIDFTAYDSSLHEIDGGQYDIDVLDLCTVAALVDEILDFMDWKDWGSYEEITSDILDGVV